MTGRGLMCLALIMAANAARAQSGPEGSADAAQRAVADFFTWYVPMARSDRGPALRALRERRAQFSTAIVNALRADFAATAQGGEEIDGLDADPFLNAQDPCDRYQPVRTTRRGRAYLVEVRGSGGCVAHEKPDVTVAIAWHAARPTFVNFLYSREVGDDLLSHLRELAKLRVAHRVLPVSLREHRARWSSTVPWRFGTSMVTTG